MKSAEPSLKTSRDVTNKISQPAQTKTSSSAVRTSGAKIVEVRRSDDVKVVSHTDRQTEKAKGKTDSSDRLQALREKPSANSAKLPQKEIITREVSKRDSVVAKNVSTKDPVGRNSLTRESANKELSFTRSGSNTIQDAAALQKRAEVYKSDMITARPSESFRENLITASETKTADVSRSLIVTEPTDTSRIVVNGDNNVIVQGDVTIEHPRPYIAPVLYHHNLAYHHWHDWHDHGTYFSFGWSSSSCGSFIWAPYHTYWGFSYYYPSYHRKFVFVSIGGHWPTYYRYRRYYWYGCHPYYWYGTHIVQEPVVYNTYNTYNYYGTAAPQSTVTTETNVYDNPPLSRTTDVVDVIDAPNDEDIVDICFAHGVKVFADGDYVEAIERFRRAVQMDPQDVIIPFTYSQALFANGEYSLAASVLRGAIAKIPDNELTIYYPRGLYEDEEILTNQVKLLEAEIAGEPFVSDYQLLLGYQYLGIGDLQKCRAPLTEAAKDEANKLTASKLLELADRLEAEQAKAEQEKSENTK